MRRALLFSIISTALLLLLCSLTTEAAPRIKVIKLAVTNPTDQNRAAENIVLSVRELKAMAPDLTPGSVIVTTSDASTLDEDARIIQTMELASQADDIDGDGRLDEIVFQLALKPRQTRVVSVAYGEAATIRRLRSAYPKRTHAKFTAKYEGMGWESRVNRVAHLFRQTQRHRCLWQAKAGIAARNLWRARV
ncbi:MAG: DUF4861 family protein [Pyrinomonadaceae bacterium]